MIVIGNAFKKWHSPQTMKMQATYLRDFKNQWKYDRITIIYDHAIAKYKEYDLHLLFPTYGTLVMIVI